MFLPIKYAQCKSLLKRWPFIGKQQSGFTSFTLKPFSEVIYHVWTKNFWTIEDNNINLLKENETWAKFWDVMVGFALKHKFPELSLLSDLSFTFTLVFTNPSKPQQNQTKPHKSPLHLYNSPTTEMDFTEHSQTQTCR